MNAAFTGPMLCFALIYVYFVLFSDAKKAYFTIIMQPRIWGSWYAYGCDFFNISFLAGCSCWSPEWLM